MLGPGDWLGCGEWLGLGDWLGRGDWLGWFLGLGDGRGLVVGILPCLCTGLGWPDMLTGL